MNLNFIRSIMTGLAGVIPLIVVFFGCTTGVDGAIDCSLSWVSPQYALILSGILGVLSFILKAFSQGGTVTENLANKSVVVTPEVKEGTVTPSQVAGG